MNQLCTYLQSQYLVVVAVLSPEGTVGVGAVGVGAVGDGAVGAMGPAPV